MNKLSTAKRVQVVAALCEGNSIRSTVRMSGAAKGTVLKLLADLGTACLDYQRAVMVDLPCKRVQCDEIWSFVYAKERNVPQAMRALQPKRSFSKPACEGNDLVGSVWTWTAIDADTKLIIGWLVGDRDAGAAYDFIMDLADRLANRVQLTTDGHKAYLNAVDFAFGGQVDYAMLVKIYGDAPEPAGRYSPAKCIGTRSDAISGDPDPDHVSTSYIERSNLTLRMANRRFTRLTNAFSKKLENHSHMIALYTVWYNFVKMHKTLKMTPALAANVGKTLWSINDLVALVDTHDAAKPRQKPGRKPKAP